MVTVCLQQVITFCETGSIAEWLYKILCIPVHIYCQIPLKSISLMGLIHHERILDKSVANWSWWPNLQTLISNHITCISKQVLHIKNKGERKKKKKVSEKKMKTGITRLATIYIPSLTWPTFSLKLLKLYNT